MIRQVKGIQGVGNAFALSGGAISLEQLVASLEDNYGYTCTPPDAPTISGLYPSSGPIGTQVVISGANFYSVSSVLIGEAPMLYSRISPMEIRATVPTGATTGRIRIVAYQNTIESNTDFTVTGPIRYSVTYNGNGSTSGVAPTDSNTYLPGDTVTVLGSGTLARTGYEFDGWKLSEGD